MNMTLSIDTWRHFAIACGVFLFIAAGLHFANNSGMREVDLRAIAAISFSAQVFVAALAVGFVAWGGARLVRWKSDIAPDMKDTVLWTACLFGLICVALAVMR